MSMNKSFRSYVVLPLLSALLFWLAWPPLPTTFFIFFAFVPMLINYELMKKQQLKRAGFKFWLADFIALLFFNIFTTWWVSATYLGTHEFSSIIAGGFSNLANAALMTLPFLLFRYTKKYTSQTIAYISLICYWIAFEYLHLRWEFTWPWLTLGNVFAVHHTWIQWYAFTGALGGSIWVWILNILIFFRFSSLLQQKPKALTKFQYDKKYKSDLAILFIFLLPVIISLNIYRNTADEGEPINVTVVQPNIDPYKEKFNSPVKFQVQKMLNLAKEKITDSTDYVVFPETAIASEIYLDKGLPNSKYVRMMRTLTDSFPNLTIIIGINALAEYAHAGTSNTERILYNERTKDTVILDAFNTAIQIDSSKNVPYYHKSKLVPGVERMPYPGAMKFLEGLAMNLGGISGSLGTQTLRSALCNSQNTCVATVICYESIFGEYVSRYVKEGAEVIFIITNDGWWSDTDGHLQHYLYAKLRAIETRKSIARSANTGTSCFINQRGDVSMETAWETDAALNKTIYKNDIKTFYTKHGDYLAKILLVLGAIIFLYTFLNKFIFKKNHLQ